MSFRNKLFSPLIILAVVLGIAACGGGAQSTSPETTQPAEQATEAPEATETPEATKAPEATEAPEATNTSETAETRTVEDALGERTIEGTPERIVALEWTYVEDLLALGIQPVGVADVEGYGNWVNAEPALAEDVTDVGTRQEPSLEAILQLEPDLIIGAQFRHEPIHNELSSIAPTLLFNPYPEASGPDQLAEMKATFQTIAEATGRQEAGEQVLAEMEASFEEAAATLEAAGHSGAPVVLAQAFTAGNAPEIRLFTDNAMAMRILEEIGLENAWEGEFEPYGFSTVGPEALAQVEQAHFFYVVQEDDDVFANLEGNAVWEELAFVKEGRTHSLGSDTWLFGGPLSAQLLVDKVVSALQ